MKLRTVAILATISITMSGCRRTESASPAPKVNVPDAPNTSGPSALAATTKDDALALAFAKQLTLTDLDPEQSPVSWTTEKLLDKNGRRYLVHLVARGRSRKLEISHSEDGKASQIGLKSYLVALELTPDGAFTHHPEAGLVLVDEPPSPSQLDYPRAASGWPGHDMQRYGTKYENGEKPGVQPEPLSFLAARLPSAQSNDTADLNSVLREVHWGSAPTPDLISIPGTTSDGPALYKRPQKVLLWGVGLEEELQYAHGRLCSVRFEGIPPERCDSFFAALETSIGRVKPSEDGAFAWSLPGNARAVWAREATGEGGLAIFSLEEMRTVTFYGMSNEVLQDLAVSARRLGPPQATYLKSIEEELRNRAAKGGAGSPQPPGNSSTGQKLEAEAVSAGEERLGSKVGTVAQEQFAGTEVALAREFNKRIDRLVVTKNVEKGLIKVSFSFKDSMCPSCRLLLRLFDQNGAYLTHLTSEPLYKVFGMDSGQGIGGHTLTYRVPVRDLRDARVAEFGYLYSR